MSATTDLRGELLALVDVLGDEYRDCSAAASEALGRWMGLADACDLLSAGHAEAAHLLHGFITAAWDAYLAAAAARADVHRRSMGVWDLLAELRAQP